MVANKRGRMANRASNQPTESFSNCTQAVQRKLRVVDVRCICIILVLLITMHMLSICTCDQTNCRLVLVKNAMRSVGICRFLGAVGMETDANKVDSTRVSGSERRQRGRSHGDVLPGDPHRYFALWPNGTHTYSCAAAAAAARTLRPTASGL